MVGHPSDSLASCYYYYHYHHHHHFFALGRKDPRKKFTITVNPLIEAGSHIQVGSLIEARRSNSDVLENPGLQ